MYPALAQSDAQVAPTDQGTLNVRLSTTPENPDPGALKLNIDFLNPKTDKIQAHIDYRVTVAKDGTNFFGPIPLTHTSPGSVKIPVELNEEGVYDVTIEVEGILFQPIPVEKVIFNLPIGKIQETISVPDWVRNNAGWWSEGLIEDSDFVQGIQYLIQQDIMKIPPTQSGSDSTQDIPAWIKNNAGWWASGQISDNDFVQGIQWLITNGIMTV